MQEQKDMTHTLPLSEMTIEEKLQMMEALWDDLSRNPSGLAAPHWHGPMLSEREDAIEQGEDRFEDWNQARRKIEEQTR